MRCPSCFVGTVCEKRETDMSARVSLQRSCLLILSYPLLKTHHERSPNNSLCMRAIQIIISLALKAKLRRYHTMKPSNSFILLSSALLLQAAGAQERTTCTDFAALSAAAANCIATHNQFATHNCTGLTDVNFGSDCDGKVKEHCAEIEACLECEEEIDALFDCEK